MNNNDTVWKHRLTLVFWGSLLTAYSAMAAGVVIDVLKNGYADLGQVQAVTVDTPADQRSLAASQIAAVQRARSGAPFAALPPGSTMKVIWPDGSSEYVVVVDPSASIGVQPIGGTLRDSNGQAVEARSKLSDTIQDQAAEPQAASSAVKQQGQRVAPLRQ